MEFLAYLHRILSMESSLRSVKIFTANEIDHGKENRKTHENVARDQRDKQSRYFLYMEIVWFLRF